MTDILQDFSRVPYIALLFLLSFPAISADRVSFSIGNNEHAEIGRDTLTATSSLSATVIEGAKFFITHKIQKKGAERTEFTEFDFIGMHASNILYQISHGSGQSSNYFSRSSTRLKLQKDNIRSGVGGYYEYNEDNYGFGTYRQVEFGPGYTWMDNLFYMGMRIERAGGNKVAFLHHVSVNHKFKHIVGRVQARLYTGQQYVFTDSTIETPQFGFKIKINGEWLPPNMIRNSVLTYGANGMVINNESNLFRRAGVSIGIKYRYQ